MQARMWGANGGSGMYIYAICGKLKKPITSEYEIEGANGVKVTQKINVTHKWYVGQTVSPLRVLEQALAKFVDASDFANEWPGMWILPVHDPSTLDIFEGAAIEVLRDWWGNWKGPLVTLNGKLEHSRLTETRVAGQDQICVQWDKDHNPLVPQAIDWSIGETPRNGTVYVSAPMAGSWRASRAMSDLVKAVKASYTVAETDAGTNSANPLHTMDGSEDTNGSDVWVKAFPFSGKTITMISPQNLAEKLDANSLIFSSLANDDFEDGREIRAGSYEDLDQWHDYTRGRACKWADRHAARTAAHDLADPASLVSLFGKRVLLGGWGIARSQATRTSNCSGNCYCPEGLGWVTSTYRDKRGAKQTQYAVPLIDHDQPSYNRWLDDKGEGLLGQILDDSDPGVGWINRHGTLAGRYQLEASEDSQDQGGD